MEHVDAYAIFAKVGELRSISGAARALGLPKANVSRAVSRLEAIYQVALVDRTGRRIALTEVGRSLHARSLRVLEEIEQAEAEIAAHRGQPSGTLRVGCPAHVARDVLADNLFEFLERYPDINLRLRVGERLMPEPGRLDIVLHAGWLSDSRLIERKISEIPTILVASQGYAKTHGLPTSVEDLSRHAIVGNFYLDRAATEASGLPAHVPLLELSRGRERYTVPIWQRFASTDQMLMLGIVRRSAAIAPIAASTIVEELRSGELIHVLPSYSISDPPALYALYTERAAIVPKLEVFIDFVLELVLRQRDLINTLLPPGGPANF